MAETSKKPSWLKVRAPGSSEYLATRGIVKGRRLHTVCEEAHCPNIGDCWSHSTATFLIMGDRCTRSCRFCAVKKQSQTSVNALDADEPVRVGKAAGELHLKHVVVTSVTRDDLPDGGASHFAAVVRALHEHAPACSVELLVPDFKGSVEALRVVMESGVDILNHNVETVPRLYSMVRPQSDFRRSLSTLKIAKELAPGAKTKSGIMVGLGETREEVLEVMDHLRASNVDIMTIGQYLRPSPDQLPVHAWVTPEEFKEYESEGLSRGFLFMESAPLVRSSYHAWKHSEGVKNT